MPYAVAEDVVGEGDIDQVKLLEVGEEAPVGDICQHMNDRELEIGELGEEEFALLGLGRS